MSHKICCTCKKEKLLIEFGKSSNSKDGYKPRCKECRTIEHQIYIEKNPNHYKKVYEKNLMANPNYNKEKHLKAMEKPNYCREKYLKCLERNPNYNSDRYIKAKEKNPTISRDNYSKLLQDKERLDRHKATLRKYRRSEIGKSVDANKRHKRRLAIKNSSHIPTSQELKNIRVNATHCYYCNVEFNDSILKTIDHYIPLSKGGEHNMDNLVICCRYCNSKKRNIMPEEFIKRIA